jgi:WD40 repeat protein
MNEGEDDDGGESITITTEENPMDVSFRDPSGTAFAIGLITGGVEMWRRTTTQTKNDKKKVKKTSTIQAHSESVRALSYMKGGEILATGSGDRSVMLIDANTEQAVGRIAEAHEEAITRLTVLDDANGVIATGCDEGVIKIWDVREERCAHSFKKDEIFVDFVSEMYHETTSERNALVATSGDGTLACLDLTAMKVLGQSDNMEDELLSCCVVKNGSKVVAGSQGGNLNIWNYGDWIESNDRFPGHPSSVDAMVKVSEDIVLTGSSDGLIRVITVFPNQMLGLVGEHGEYPIERMRLTADLNTLASASHDHTVKIWDVSFLHEEDPGGGEGDAMDTENKEDDDDSDMDDSDSEDERKKKKQKKKKGKGKNRRLPGRGSDMHTNAAKKKAAKFFEGL